MICGSARFQPRDGETSQRLRGPCRCVTGWTQERSQVRNPDAASEGRPRQARCSPPVQCYDRSRDDQSHASEPRRKHGDIVVASQAGDGSCRRDKILARFSPSGHRASMRPASRNWRTLLHNVRHNKGTGAGLAAATAEIRGRVGRLLHRSAITRRGGQPPARSRQLRGARLPRTRPRTWASPFGTDKIERVPVVGTVPLARHEVRADQGSIWRLRAIRCGGRGSALVDGWCAGRPSRQAVHPHVNAG